MTFLRSVAVVLGGLSLGCGQGPPVAAQEPGSKIWVGRYQEIEEYLRISDCVSLRWFAPNWAAQCALRPGGPVARMAWRSRPPGVYQGFGENYKAEIAAYELDKLLKMDMVPPTVERQLEGNKGAAQLWVENVVDGLDPAVPEGPMRVHWDNQLARMVLFDNLIGNRSRNQRNMLRDRAWNLILIDHSRAFGTGAELLHARRGIDDRYWARIEGLTRAQLDAALGPWLDEHQIGAILDRRERLRADIKLPPK
jgi:hypothetical protein